MGTSIALHLVELGVDEVVLLEKSFLGAGSTGKSGAILRQHYSHEVTVRMARESLKYYESFHQRHGRNIDFRQPGMLFLARESEREALEQNVRLQRSLGVDTKLLEAEFLREADPQARFREDALAAWEPEAAYVDPHASRPWFRRSGPRSGRYCSNWGNRGRDRGREWEDSRRSDIRRRDY